MGHPVDSGTKPTALQISLPEGDAELLRGGTLEASLSPGSNGAAVVAPPHPLYGGHMSHPLVGAMVKALFARRIGALAFNWRGVGASAGSASGDAALADVDYRAALERVRGAGPLYACGYSFGAAAAIRVAALESTVSHRILVAPPAAMIDAGTFRRFAGLTFLAVGERDGLVDLDALRELAEGQASVHLCVLDGTDHFFAGAGVSELGVRLGKWLDHSS